MTSEKTGGPLYGLVEAGGTKFVLGVARDRDTICDSCRIPTTTPEETIGAMLEWFSAQPRLSAIGVASFGPIELDRDRAQWGRILETVKPGWSGADVAGPLIRRFGCPLGLDTDVNGAALAESRWGAGQGHHSVVYLTIGTGIGGGAVIGGQTLRGVSHPEMGHFRPPRHPDDRDFPGVCPFHGDCMEGLASGPAVMARYGASLSQLPPDHPAHAIIAWYLAQLAMTIQAIFEPGRIIMGGGVMKAPGLIDRVRTETMALGGGYFRSSPAEVITAPGLGEHSGLLGGLALAQAALAG